VEASKEEWERPEAISAKSAREDYLHCLSGLKKGKIGRGCGEGLSLNRGGESLWGKTMPEKKAKKVQATKEKDREILVWRET